ncbi:hypothetical protein EE612_047683 [Oryza sativa]|nr:hypothetical protein EE612_047683 [Oryza sativa]
MDGKTFSSHI